MTVATRTSGEAGHLASRVAIRRPSVRRANMVSILWRRRERSASCLIGALRPPRDGMSGEIPISIRALRNRLALPGPLEPVALSGSTAAGPEQDGRVRDGGQHRPRPDVVRGLTRREEHPDRSLRLAANVQSRVEAALHAPDQPPPICKGPLLNREARCGPVRLRVGGVDHHDLAVRGGRGRFGDDRGDHARQAPPLPVVERLRPDIARRFIPLQSIVLNEDYPAQHQPVVDPRLAAAFGR